MAELTAVVDVGYLVLGDWCPCLKKFMEAPLDFGIPEEKVAELVDC
jgi:hypothetical protein